MSISIKKLTLPTLELTLIGRRPIEFQGGIGQARICARACIEITDTVAKIVRISAFRMEHHEEKTYFQLMTLPSDVKEGDRPYIGCIKQVISPPDTKSYDEKLKQYVFPKITQLKWSESISEDDRTGGLLRYFLVGIEQNIALVFPNVKMLIKSMEEEMNNRWRSIPNPENKK